MRILHAHCLYFAKSTTLMHLFCKQSHQESWELLKTVFLCSYFLGVYYLRTVSPVNGCLFSVHEVSPNSTQSNDLQPSEQIKSDRSSLFREFDNRSVQLVEIAPFVIPIVSSIQRAPRGWLNSLKAVSSIITCMSMNHYLNVSSTSKRNSKGISPQTSTSGSP